MATPGRIFYAKRCTPTVAVGPATAVKNTNARERREREIKSRRGRRHLCSGSLAAGAQRVQRRAVRATDTAGSAACPCRSDIRPCRATTSCRASTRPGWSSRAVSDRRHCRHLAAWVVSGVAKTLAVGRLKLAKGEKEHTVAVSALGQTSGAEASQTREEQRHEGRAQGHFSGRRTCRMGTGRGWRCSFFLHKAAVLVVL